VFLFSFLHIDPVCIVSYVESRAIASMTMSAKETQRDTERDRKGLMTERQREIQHSPLYH
jgi:hypothetical protein